MEKQQPFCNPEIWGGIECTINRVGDDFFDQLEYGNYYKQSKEEAIASLGIRKLRFPILWEKHQPKPNTRINWSFVEGQLNFFREKNIEVIAGLVHHGSGPAFTDLTDPEFPYLLAEYAGKVARKFPWINYYTPINEPLTTARFSGLYGLWYPHGKNDKVFISALLNQIKGIILAMQEIRKINPHAKLVQTEDLGKTYSTPLLKYQANFENERRWLTYDLLTGKLDEKHKLWKYFIRHKTPVEHLNYFHENTCEPEVFGFNHYLTSERYLDEKREAYPPHTYGGNKRHRYADVEAVRVELDEPTGISVLLKEAWERYRKPIAVTEVHLHCHREEQIRWFRYVWNACNELKKQGVGIQAVTSWAVLGSFGWNKLLTKPKGMYEPGAFDISSGFVRPTALAKYIQQLTGTNSCNHFLGNSQGWWERSSRLLYTLPNKIRSSGSGRHKEAPVLIIGKRGTLGQAFARGCQERELRYHLLSRQDCDIADSVSIERAIDRYKPWAIINAAGYVRVDDAEKETDICFRENTKGATNLAITCKQHGIKLLTFSSDLVFDGQKARPYVESDPVNPLNVYGSSKVKAEQVVLKHFPEALVIRTSAFFGPWDEYNFNYWVESSLSNGQPITVADDVHISPTYVPDLVHTGLDLLVDHERDIWHVANKGSLTWTDLAYEVADQLDLDHHLITAVPSSGMGWVAERPKYSVLSSEKCGIMPSLENALERYFEARKKSGIFVA